MLGGADVVEDEPLHILLGDGRDEHVEGRPTSFSARVAAAARHDDDDETESQSAESNSYADIERGVPIARALSRHVATSSSSNRSSLSMVFATPSQPIDIPLAPLMHSHGHRNSASHSSLTNIITGSAMRSSPTRLQVEHVSFSIDDQLQKDPAPASSSAPSTNQGNLRSLLAKPYAALKRRRSSLGSVGSNTLYGRLIVLGYQASISSISPDPQKIAAIREGGNHTFYLYRRQTPNGYTLPPAPISLTPLMFRIKINPTDSPIVSLIQPFTPPMPITDSAEVPSISIPGPNSAAAAAAASYHPPISRKDSFSSASISMGPLLHIPLTKSASFDQSSFTHSHAQSGGPNSTSHGYDPFASDSEGTRPRCVAIKVNTGIHQKKYLVHWCLPSDATDIYQIGREPGTGVDMVVPGASYLHPSAGIAAAIPTSMRSTPPTTISTTLVSSSQSRLPFRLVCSRASLSTSKQRPTMGLSNSPINSEKSSPSATSSGGASGLTAAAASSSGASTPIVRIFAGAFDAAGRLVLDDEALRLNTVVDGKTVVDALVGNSVVVSRSDWNGQWVEVSALYGHAYTLRTEAGSAGKRVTHLPGTHGNGVELGREALICSGGAYFQWRGGGGGGSTGSGCNDTGEAEWAMEEFAAMLREVESQAVCPVTLDTIETEGVTESIKARSLRPWDRLVARLRWVGGAVSGSSGPVNGRGMGLIAGGATSKEEFTRRPWVFVKCGHVASFIDASLSPHSSTDTLCFVCRTSSPFIPLIARLNPLLLSGRATHVFDPCGHMIHEAGARYWGDEIAVPRVGKDPRVWDAEPIVGPVVVSSETGRRRGWCHICPFCAGEIFGYQKLYWAIDN